MTIFTVIMAKDILLYGSIWEYSALFFFDQIKEALEEDAEAELTLRMNCEGGSPEYGMSVIEKVREMASQFSTKVGAMAHSMGFFILCYLDTDKVEALDTTQSVLHRAAYPDWIEGGSNFKGSIYEEILAKTNKDLEKAVRAKVNVEVLESLPQFKNKNITLKDIFSMESRIEVLLTGADLKKIGLVGRINKISPTKSAELKSQVDTFNKCKTIDEFRMAAKAISTEVPKPEKTENPTTMTLAELKAQHPAVYAEAVAEGIAKEKDRVEACMVFVEIDPAGVKAAIESGKNLTAKQMAEFSMKVMAKGKLEEIKKDANGNVITAETSTGEKTEKEKSVSTFADGVKASILQINGGRTNKPVPAQA